MAKDFNVFNTFCKSPYISLTTKNAYDIKIGSPSDKQQFINKRYFEAKPKQQRDVHHSITPTSRNTKLIVQQSKSQLEKENQFTPLTKGQSQSQCSQYSTTDSQTQHTIYPTFNSDSKINQYIKSHIKSYHNFQRQKAPITTILQKRTSEPQLLLSNLIKNQKQQRQSMEELKLFENENQQTKVFIPSTQSLINKCELTIDSQNNEKKQDISIERIKCFTIEKMPKSCKINTTIQNRNGSVEDNKLTKIYQYILDGNK